MLDGEVPTLGSLQRVLGGLVGHEPGDRLGDQPLQRGQTDAVRERRHLGIHEPRRLLAEPEGGFGDPAGPPGLEVPGLHPGPGPREPVLQLDRGRDDRTTGVGGAADGERELRDAELRDQRSTRTGQWETGVAGRGDPRRRFVRSTPVGAARPRSPPRSTAPRPRGWLRHGPRGLTRSTSLGESSSPGVIGAVDVMTQFKQRPLTDSGEFPLLWKGILDFFSIWVVVPACSWSYGLGLVCPLASLAARPPGVAVGLRGHVQFRAATAVASLAPNHRGSGPPMTTPGCGRPLGSVVSRRSLRSLLNHRGVAARSSTTGVWRLAAQPTGSAAARTSASKRRWSRPASGCHWTPRQKRVPSASIASSVPSAARAEAT